MCSFRSALAVAAFSLAACSHDSSVGSDNPDAAGGNADSGSGGGSDATLPAVDCTGKVFVINGPAATAHREATQPLEIILGGQADDVMGAQGALDDGTFFSLRRDGDYSDGDLAQIGNYDVSQYPYNILYSHAPVPHDSCEGTASCTDWVAIAGTFSVAQVKPVWRATFMISNLREGDSPDGPPIAGAVTGCFAVPNP